MLELSGVVVDRSGFSVIRGVDLVAESGAVTVLLGPNGAGKTTLLESVSGIIPTVDGKTTLGDKDITKATRAARAKAGLAHVEQGRTIFADLTVAENIETVADRDGIRRAFELFPELEARRDVRSSLCSGGEQQMLVIARSLAMNPSLVMIDELSLGLAPVIVKRLMPVVRQLADDGVGVLLVEQYAFQALSIGDRAYVLNRGEIVFSGKASELIDEPERLKQAYLGHDSREPTADVATTASADRPADG